MVDVNVTGREICELVIYIYIYKNRNEHGASQYRRFPFFVSQAKLLEMSNRAPAGDCFECGVSKNLFFFVFLMIYKTFLRE